MILLSFGGQWIKWCSRGFTYIQTGGYSENQWLIDTTYSPSVKIYVQDIEGLSITERSYILGLSLPNQLRERGCSLNRCYT